MINRIGSSQKKQAEPYTGDNEGPVNTETCSLPEPDA